MKGTEGEPKVLTGIIQPSAFTQASEHSHTRFAFLINLVPAKMGFSRQCSEPWQGGCLQSSGRHVHPRRGYPYPPIFSWALECGRDPALPSCLPAPVAGPLGSSLTAQDFPWLLLNCITGRHLCFCCFIHFQTAQTEQENGGNDRGRGERRGWP